MKRNYRKLLADYEKKFENSNSCQLFVSDFQSVRQLAIEEEAGKVVSSVDREWNDIGVALKAGIMIGYAAGRADRNRNKEKEVKSRE